MSRGRANVIARLVNPLFGTLVENATLEVLPSNGYETERDSAVLAIGTLDAGQECPISIWLQPREKQTSLTVRVTYRITSYNVCYTKLLR